MSSSTEKNDGYGASELQENIEILRQIEYFSALPLESLKVFAYISHRESFKPGDLLFEQGEEDGQALFIISGSARMLRSTGSGDLEVRRVEAGESLGVLSLLGAVKRLYSLEALEETLCLVMDRDKFRSTAERFPQAWPKVIKGVVESVAAWEERFLAADDPDFESCGRLVGVSLI